MSEQEKEFEKILETMIVYLAIGSEKAWVNLRKVWEFLGVSERFNAWAVRRLTENRSAEGTTHVTCKDGFAVASDGKSLVPKFRYGNSTGVTETPVMGGPQFQPTEYLVTLDMVALICMSERTEKGLFCKLFFLRRSVEFEKAKIAGALPVPAVLSPKELAWKYYEAECERERLAAVSSKCIAEVELANNTVNVAIGFVKEHTDRLAEDCFVAYQSRKGESYELWCGTLVAKWLEVPRKVFFAALRASGMFYDIAVGHHGKTVLTPCDYVQKTGYCCVVTEVVNKNTPAEQTVSGLRFKKKGWLWIGSYLEERGLLVLPPNILTKIADEKVHLNKLSEVEREARIKALKEELEGNNGGHLNVFGAAQQSALSAAGAVLPIQSNTHAGAPVVDLPALDTGAIRCAM